MKKILAVAAALLLALSAFAQSGQTIKIKLQDASTGEAVAFATVSLTPDGAEKASKYVLSNDAGEATITGVRKGDYTVKAELMGYKPFVKTVSVAKDPVDLGSAKMELDSEVLDAASVSAIGNPIVVKKDTVEYNASSFKVTDNDMLEDLLKKLPGVEVAADGTVTANGQTISKITIDGKTFFLDDPSLASKNLPAKIIDKVKVIEKKSDQAIFTGIDDGEEETIIDLKMRPGMMKGWFGNVMGGGGHDIQYVGMEPLQPARWQTAAMVGRFTDKSQISVIINANNTNNRGFNDMAGSMMQAMRGGGGGMGRGAGGWGGNNGVTTSWMGGLNGVFSLCDGDMDLGGNYLYSGTKKIVAEWSQKDTYLEDGSVLRYKDSGPYSLQGNFDPTDGIYGVNNTLNQGHRFGIRLEHKFSEKTSILFEPQFNFGNGTFSEYSNNETWTRAAGAAEDDYQLTNHGFTSTSGANKNWSASGFLLFRQRLNKPGRTISANARYSFSGNSMLGYNQSLSEVAATSVKNITNQFYESSSKGYSVNTRVSYTEPLAEFLFLEAYASYGWNKNVSLRDTYDSGNNDGMVFSTDRPFIPLEAFSREGMAINDTYSRDITNTYQNIRTGANIQFQNEKIRAQLGAAYQPTITDNITKGKDPYHSIVHNWSPQAMFSYDFSDNSNIRFFYNGRSNQPSTSQLIPVPDNSNPLSVRFGNPYLTPYFNHNLRGQFGYTNKKTFFSIRGNFNAGLVQSGITNAQWYDAAGVQYAMPMNGGLSGNASLGFFLNAPFGQSGFSLSNMFDMSYSNSRTYVGKSDDYVKTQLASYYDKVSAEFNYEQFNSDFFTDKTLDFNEYFITNITQSMNVSERLRATYRNDFVEVNLSARTRFNKPWYTIANASQKMTWNNQVSGSMQWTIPSGTGINVDCRYNWYNNYTTPQTPECILNAELTQLFFKNQFTISLKCYDILNQSKNHYVTDSANYHTETLNNTLGRYIMVSLVYRFGNFGKAGKQMQARSGQGGPGGYRGPMGGGPMGGGRPPMGGGPR